MPPTNEDLTSDIISATHQLYVDRLRKYLGDTAELNTLSGAEECSDIFLYHCLQAAMDEFNFEFIPETTYTITSIPSWNVLKLGATIQVLIGKGILSARNTLSYSDAGGVTIQDYDTYGRYINFYNLLINKYMRSVQSMKVSSNVDSCYGGVSSEYSDIGTL
jgi:hypothetical protein